jgi:hypothetical protein
MLDTLLIPFQPTLPKVLPTIEGNVDYRDLRDQLLRMDHLLIQSGLETQLLEARLQRWLGQHPQASPKAQQNQQLHSRRALRCNLARILIRETPRGFAARLADSPLLQFFCDLSELGRVKVPAKSTLQRYGQWWEESEVRQLLQQLLVLGAKAPQQLHLPQAVDLETAFLDTTCLRAHIHYPVDWVLLRDATRTLMKSVQLIRQQGLKHRMEEPASFISRINKLCMQMTHAWNKADRQRQRKKTLRQIWIAWWARCATMPDAIASCWSRVGSRPNGLARRPTRSSGAWTRFWSSCPRPGTRGVSGFWRANKWTVRKRSSASTNRR